MINEDMGEQTISQTIVHLKHGNTNVINNIKILIYKENPNLFDLLDFNDDDIFKEPLLFAYFNNKEKSNTLEQLLFGYISKEKRPINLLVYSDKNGKVYLPNYGWLCTSKANQIFDLQLKSNSIFLQLNNEVVNYRQGKQNC